MAEPRRTARRPIDALEIAIRRLRLLVCALLVGVAATGGSGLADDLSTGATVGMILLPLVLLIANAASRATVVHPERVRELTLAQLAADTVVTVAALWLLDPARGSYALIVTCLPVLHGALRYRLQGAFAVWLAVGSGLGIQMILEWRPGLGLAPIFDLAVPMAVALAAAIPAGHLADQLTEEIAELEDQRSLARLQGRMLAVLTLAGQDFSSQDRRRLAQTAVEACCELGFAGGALVELSPNRPPRSISEAGQPIAADLDVLSLNIPDRALGHVVESASGLQLGLVQVGETRIVLAAVRSPGDTPIQARHEAFALLVRNLTAAVTTVVGYEHLQVLSSRHRYEATHDHLTGLLNRAGFVDAFDALQRRRPHRPFGLLMLDLNGFKRVNDTYGHEAGDAVLVATAERLGDAVPASIAAARLGGDEFALLVEPDADGMFVNSIAAIERVMRTGFEFGHHAVSVGTAIGERMVTSADVSLEDASRHADARMYEHKRSIGSPSRMPSPPPPAHRH